MAFRIRTDRVHVRCRMPAPVIGALLHAGAGSSNSLSRVFRLTAAAREGGRSMAESLSKFDTCSLSNNLSAQQRHQRVWSRQQATHPLTSQVENLSRSCRAGR